MCSLLTQLNDVVNKPLSPILTGRNNGSRMEVLDLTDKTLIKPTSLSKIQFIDDFTSCDENSSVRNLSTSAQSSHHNSPASKNNTIRRSVAEDIALGRHLKAPETQEHGNIHVAGSSLVFSAKRAAPESIYSPVASHSNGIVTTRKGLVPLASKHSTIKSLGVRADSNQIGIKAIKSSNASPSKTSILTSLQL